MQKPTEYKVFNEKYYRDRSAPVLADKYTDQFQHRQIAGFASEGFKRSHRVLNVGCGLGLLSFRLSEYCDHVVSVDASVYGPAKAKSMYGNRGMFWMSANGENLPFKPKVFDCVVASHLFEHLTDEQAARVQNEIYRVLKEGGSLVVEQPLFGKMSIPDMILLLLFSSLRAKRYYYYSLKEIRRAKAENPQADFHHLEKVGDPTHRRVYDIKLLAHELSKAGFGKFKFSRRRIFSILFFYREDIFEYYVKFYIRAPEIIRRLFLVSIGGRVRAIKDE